ncbi:beta-lactamase [Pseudonocardia sp. EC080610-09]|nr:beta-lactamase [Pseudonocardia sp. EC080625-04]ALL76883.1 beta-lactamase [Pseudonocardia sp. EC080610-09]ALL83914.1 beta-lactamase [Pseudonocardia sp. EC080619-01]
MMLTVLGCRAAMPADGQASSAYLVSTDSTRVLLDCGPGAVTALGAVSTPAALDGIVISHLHTDHCYDVLPLGKALLTSRMLGNDRFPTLPTAGPAPGDRPIPLHVPKGGRAALERLAAVFRIPSRPELDRAFGAALEIREYEPGEELTIGDCRVVLRPLHHTMSNCGVRVTDPAGSSLVYSGDTSDVAGLSELARGADLLLCESTLELPDDTSDGHMSAARAGRVAAAAEVGQLVLTHFVTADPTWLDARRAEACESFAGPVHLAAPERVFPVC